MAEAKSQPWTSRTGWSSWIAVASGTGYPARGAEGFSCGVANIEVADGR